MGTVRSNLDAIFEWMEKLMDSIKPVIKEITEKELKKRMRPNDIFKSINKRDGAIILKGSGGIGKSTLITQTTAQLQQNGYEFIVIRGSTTVEEILEAISIKAVSLGLDYAEKIFDAFDEPEGKLTWYLDHFLLKQKVAIIFDYFEANQDEERAGEFKQERLKKFLWFFRDRLKHHETFLFISTRYPLPGFDSPGMTKNIRGFSALEIMKKSERKKYHQTAVKYFEAIPEEEGKLYLHYRFEARRHYLRARQWNKAAKITIDLCPYLMDRGYLVCAVELLRELEMKKLSEKNKAEIHSCLGSIHGEFNEYEKALSRYTAALEIAKKINDLKCTARYMRQIGNIYYRKGDCDYAFSQYHQALGISDKIGDNNGIAYSLQQIGVFYQFRGDYDAALDNFKKSLEIKEKIGDTLGSAKNMFQIGMLYYDKRDYEASLAAFQEAKEEYGEIPHFRGVKGVASTWHWLGMVYQARCDYDAALDNFQKANEELEKIADFRDMCYNFYRIGMINNDKGNYEAALKNLQKAKELFEKNGATRNVANILHEMGKIHQKREDYETALEYFLQSSLHFTKIGEPDANQVREDISRIRENLPEEQFNSILQEFSVPADFLDNEDDREQEQFVEFLASLTRDAAAAREKNSEEKGQLSAQLNQLIDKLSDTSEGRDLKSYFRLLLAVVKGEDYQKHLEEISEGLKELCEEMNVINIKE